MNSIIDRVTSFFAARNAEAYFVGGIVRDRLLGRGSESDLDVAFDGDALAVGRELAAELGGSLVPLSVPRGIVRVVLPGGSVGDGEAEATCTVDLSGFAHGIESDLARRDFTVNAMAVPVARWHDDDFAPAVIDPYGGKADLARRILRALTPDVFVDDPGRLLRAVRLSGEMRLLIEPETVRLLVQHSSLLPTVAPDRVREEFLRILAPGGARARIEALDRLGLLAHVVPELMAAKGVEQPRMHYWDVWGHSLHTVEGAEGVTGGHQNSPVFSCVPWTPESEAYFAEVVCDGHTRRTVLKLAALFHDIAKPQTKTVEPDGRTRFFGHSEQGAVIAEERLRHLRLSFRGVSMVSRMVEHHLRPTGMSPSGKSNNGEWPTDRAIYRYFRDVGDVSLDTLYLCLADYLGAKGPELSHPEWVNHAKMISHVLQTGSTEPVSATTPRLVNGHDLMSCFRLPPGPHIGSLLSVVEEARAAGEIDTREQALDLVATTLNTRASSDEDGRYGILPSDTLQDGSG